MNTNAENLPPNAQPKRLRVLMSAYACEPGKGSEPGVGWNVATEMAKLHDIWVLTRANNRQIIEPELEKNPIGGLKFIYYDLPRWACWWKKGGRGVQLYYYLWQLLCWKTVKQAHDKNHFDLSHHVTFGKYWVPCVLPRIPIPFIWGTVGGGESMPRAFLKDLNNKERAFEMLRSFARWLGEHNPGVLKMAESSSVALASTDETAERLRKLGSKNVQVVPQCALTDEQFNQLSALPSAPSNGLRFISMGRPLHWKGFYLGLKAFAAANIPDAEYWIIANGSGKVRLEQLSKDLDIVERVRFFDSLPSLDAVYDVLSQCHILVHPALHEAFGNVVLEAMAAGRPALTLNIGGPGLQVREGGGIAVSSASPAEAIKEMSVHMNRFVEDVTLRGRLSKDALSLVEKNMVWRVRINQFAKIYELAISNKN